MFFDSCLFLLWKKVRNIFHMENKQSVSNDKFVEKEMKHQK